MKKYTLLLLVQLLLLSAASFAQTDVQLTRYPVFGFTVPDVFDINVINLTTQTKTGYLSATILKKENSQQVAQVSSALVTLEPGLNLLSSANIAKTISFSDSYAQATGKLGFGDHEVCVAFTDAAAVEPEASACYTLSTPAYSLPYLIYPYNESVLGDKNPNLMWSIPVVQQSLDVKYKLELVEVMAGQQPNDAIINNFKMIQTDLLTSNNLFYPPTASELQYHKTYAWQVTTYMNEQAVGKTEVWAFTLLPDTFALPEDEFPLNYIIINDLNLSGIYSTRDNKLYIELDEKYVHDNVTFTVYKEEALKTVECEIAEVKKIGLNLFTLSFDNCEESLHKDVVYFLAVKGNNKIYKLKFRFKS